MKSEGIIMMYGIFCKTEYFSTWPLMHKEELAGFATVERIEQSTSTFKCGSKTMTYEEYLPGLLACGNGKNVCVQYDGGFIILYGWLRDESILIIKPMCAETINKKKQKIIYKKIIEIFDKMEDKEFMHKSPLDE